MYQQIQTTLQQLLGDGQAFYAFRQPGEEGLQLSTIQAAEPFDYGFLERSSKESGFVMFPFSQKKEQCWWFTGEPFQELAAPHQLEAPPNQTPLKVDEMPGDFPAYSAQFKEMMASLNKLEVQKVILSRTIKVSHALAN